jgi:hypothetical protein
MLWSSSSRKQSLAGIAQAFAFTGAGDPAKRWLAFHENHGEVIVAIEFFTAHPISEWVVQRLREAFPEAPPYRYVIVYRDSKFDADVIGFLKSARLKPMRTRVQAPWQNGIAERWIGSCRRELLDLSSHSVRAIFGGSSAIT